jgi:hypothetical protein
MAIRNEHLAKGMASPTDDPMLRLILRALQRGVVPDKNLLRGGASLSIGREKRREPTPSSAVTRKLLAQMFELPCRNALDRRDRALLLLGFMAALKRSALVAIDICDLRFSSDALIVKLKSEEGVSLGGELHEQQGTSVQREVAVPMTGGVLCAATAVRAWIESAALDVGDVQAPLFCRFDRGGDPTLQRLDAAYVNVILKGRLEAIGIDPKNFSGQSLIRGRLMEIGKGRL